MPINGSWITPGHIVRLTFTGNVTINDLAATRDELSMLLAETPVRLDYILDLTGLEQVTDRVLQFILSKNGSLRNAKTGCIAVTGGSEPQRLIVRSAALA